MTQPNGHAPAMQPMTVRRAVVLDADKIRYRVYRSPTDFVAVIAESALMAVKVAGIKNPHKVMRDLPAGGNSIEANHMMARDDTQAPVAFPTMPGNAPPKHFQVAMKSADVAAEKKVDFIPMGIADLRDKGGNRARILPADLLYQIIEEHAKNAPVAPVPDPEPVRAVAPQDPEELALPVQPEMTQAEKVVKMAAEILPQSAPAAAPAAAADSKPELNPDEVQKLLNE